MAARTKTQEAQENAAKNAGNADRPPQEEIDKAVAFLLRWAPKRLNPNEVPEGPKRALQCRFCHVKLESSKEDQACPKGCHDHGKSTMEPLAA